MRTFIAILSTLSLAGVLGCTSDAEDAGEPALTAADFIDTPDITDAAPVVPPRDGYELAPGGISVHASCVYEVAEGDEVSEDGATIAHADGAVVAVPPCLYPVRSQHPQVAAPRIAQATTGIDLNGWVGAGAGFAPHYITMYYANWHVPAAPARSAGQTIFLFDGTMDGSPWHEILQPVLTWGHSAIGGGPYWNIAGWRVAGGRAFHSPMRRVRAGDTIYGFGENMSGKTWRTLAYDRTSGATTMLTTQAAHLQGIDVGGALEVYNVHRCDELPRGHEVTFWGEHWFHGKPEREMSPDFEYGDYASSDCGGIHARRGQARQVVVRY
jgi:hypothetical protein